MPPHVDARNIIGTVFSIDTASACGTKTSEYPLPYLFL